MRLLRAAAAVLAEYGTTASMNAIARRAGLTKMTLYRHFASKEDLLLAVMADHYDRLRAIAEGSGGLGEYLERAILQIGPDRGYFHVALMAGGVNDVLRTSAYALHDALLRLVASAQEAGTIRPDVTPGDLHSLMLGIASTITDESWRRHLALALDGLGRVDAEIPEPAMQPADYERFMAERARLMPATRNAM